MRLLLLFLAFTLPLAAQESLLFPRFSVTGSSSPASFETNARIDPETTLSELGTEVSFERDLGLEYRPLNWLGIGGAYHYFRLNVDVKQDTLRGALDMTIRGPEAYLRLAF